MSPISYYGKQRNAKNARYLYAWVFDLDGVDMPQLRDVLHQMNTLPRQKRRTNYQKGCNITIGINMDGQKEVLGMWADENESAKFWLSLPVPKLFPYPLEKMGCLKSRLAF